MIVNDFFQIANLTQYGLIGYPLGHSFSKGYFDRKFTREGIQGCSYDNYPVSSIELFPQLIRDHPGLSGLNVTIPYKESVIQFLDSMGADAKQIGAVNCIRIRSGKLTGYNTDYLGFQESLSGILQPWHQKALILGTGGSSRAVAYALRKHKIDFLFVSRRKQHQKIVTYDDLRSSMMDQYLLLINTTPVGMFPDLHSFPDIPYDQVTPRHLLYDLIYNPEQTVFLQKGASRGATIKNGQQMLEFQAEASWKIWNAPEV